MFLMPSLLGNLLKYWKVGVTFLLAASLFVAGYRVSSWRCETLLAQERSDRATAIQQAQKLADAVEASRREMTDLLAERAVLLEKANRVVERVVTEEVIKYVETENARQCGLSSDGVSLHDSAATGSLLAPSGDAPAPSGLDGGAIEASNAKVIRVVTDNYMTCNRIRDQLILLQEWAKGL